MKKIIITRAQLNEVITLENYDNKKLKKIQNKIYRVVSDFCGKMHNDDAWQNVKTVIDMIGSVEGVEDVHVGSGKYFNYLNPEKGAYRDYQTTVVTPFGKLYGYIRCNASGTMDDIFKYYDITISLYPDKKRDLEENKVSMHKKLNEVEDALKTQVTFTGSNANEMGNNAQEKYNDATKTGLKPDSIQMSGKSTRNNASDKDETTIAFDSTQPNIRGAVTNAVQNAVNNGADINKLNVVGNSEDVTNGVAEGKRYSKKQIEEARLYEMRKNGKVMTKKQLYEEILTREQLQKIAFECNRKCIEEKLKSMNLFQALKAFRLTFGDDALQALSTNRNTFDAIVNTFINADHQKKDEFIERLDGTYQDEPIDLDIKI